MTDSNFAKFGLQFTSLTIITKKKQHKYDSAAIIEQIEQ